MSIVEEEVLVMDAGVPPPPPTSVLAQSISDWVSTIAPRLEIMVESSIKVSF